MPLYVPPRLSPERLRGALTLALRAVRSLECTRAVRGRHRRLRARQRARARGRHAAVAGAELADAEGRARGRAVVRGSGRGGAARGAAAHGAARRRARGGCDSTSAAITGPIAGRSRRSRTSDASRRASSASWRSPRPAARPGACRCGSTCIRRSGRRCARRWRARSASTKRPCRSGARGWAGRRGSRCATWRPASGRRRALARRRRSRGRRSAACGASRGCAPSGVATELGTVGEAEASWARTAMRAWRCAAWSRRCRRSIGSAGSGCPSTRSASRPRAARCTGWRSPARGSAASASSPAWRRARPTVRWLVRAARPGVTATARARPRRPRGAGTPREAADRRVGRRARHRRRRRHRERHRSASTSTATAARARTRLDVDDVTLDMPAVARQPVGGLRADRRRRDWLARRRAHRALARPSASARRV